MRWLDFGARNRLSDKGCHPFYEFPYDSAKICSFSLFAKPVLINFKKVYQNGYFIFKFSMPFFQESATKKGWPQLAAKPLYSGFCTYVINSTSGRPS